MVEKTESVQQIPAEAFKFKYVAEEELLQIVRKVRREKRKEKDALTWKQFVEVKQKSSEAEHESEGVQTPVSLHECSCSKVPFKNPVEAEIKSIPLDVQDPQTPTKQSLLTDGGVSAREMGTLQRIALLRHRISRALDSIAGMVQCQPIEPDGPDDLERRKIRINEFLSRFSRNYLFQFQMQVAELRRSLTYASPDTPGRHTEHQALVQKLVSAHQTAIQSLQVYVTQIPSSLQGTNIFGKLKDLLHHLCDLSMLKRQLDDHAGMMNLCDNNEDGDEVYVKCKELLALLDERHGELEDNNLSARTSSPVSARGGLLPRTHVGLRNHCTVRHASWKKSSVHLAQAKFGPPSSVRSSGSVHASSLQNHISQSEKISKESYICCNSQLREVVAHMHDVLCNKVAAQSLRRSSHRAKKSFKESGKRSSKNSTSAHEPLNLVQNLSKNVQLVITQHCDSETESKRHRDAATDTADLGCEKSQPALDGNKRTKKVFWASDESESSKNSIDSNLEKINAKLLLSGQSVQESSKIDNVPTQLKEASEHQISSYRKMFCEYNSRVKNPTIQRCCDSILDSVIQEISRELDPSTLLEKMYRLEFKDD